MDSDIAKSTDVSEWVRRSYNLFVVPISQIANAPPGIVDSTLAASNNEVTDVKLLYDLTLAEIGCRGCPLQCDLGLGPAGSWRAEAQ
jgi:hypothetical protein